ncbi:MAG: hypothetical protein ABL949_14865 [Fimbriimonadaceae bacterium]
MEPTLYLEFLRSKPSCVISTYTGEVTEFKADSDASLGLHAIYAVSYLATGVAISTDQLMQLIAPAQDQTSRKSNAPRLTAPTRERLKLLGWGPSTGRIEYFIPKDVAASSDIDARFKVVLQHIESLLDTVHPSKTFDDFSSACAALIGSCKDLFLCPSESADRVVKAAVAARLQSEPTLGTLTQIIQKFASRQDGDLIRYSLHTPREALIMLLISALHRKQTKSGSYSLSMRAEGAVIQFQEILLGWINQGELIQVDDDLMEVVNAEVQRMLDVPDARHVGRALSIVKYLITLAEGDRAATCLALVPSELAERVGLAREFYDIRGRLTMFQSRDRRDGVSLENRLKGLYAAIADFESSAKFCDGYSRALKWVQCANSYRHIWEQITDYGTNSKGEIDDKANALEKEQKLLKKAAPELIQAHALARWSYHRAAAMAACRGTYELTSENESLEQLYALGVSCGFSKDLSTAHAEFTKAYCYEQHSNRRGNPHELRRAMQSFRKSCEHFEKAFGPAHWWTLNACDAWQKTADSLGDQEQVQLSLSAFLRLQNAAKS